MKIPLPRQRSDDMNEPCVWSKCERLARQRFDAPLCNDHALSAWGAVSAVVNSDQMRGGARTAVPDVQHITGYRDSQQGWVYAIRLGSRIKIGVTTDVEQRMQALPHEEVLTVAQGRFYLEQQMHRHLSPYRVTGEWFDDVPEVRHAIDQTLRQLRQWRSYDGPRSRVLTSETRARVASRPPSMPTSWGTPWD